MALTVGSLFSGIGGIDLGLERAGMVTRWFVEWDAHCQNVLRRHWLGLPVYGDITTVDWSTVEPVDVLAGGFPCQPVSVAGRALAQADDRWLWPAFRDAIGALRPRYVLVENVPGLLQRGLGIVLSDLAELGYDAEWECIPAAAVGAPHLRNRLWLIAYRAEQRRIVADADHGRSLDTICSGRNAAGNGGKDELADPSRLMVRARPSESRSMGEAPSRAGESRQGSIRRSVAHRGLSDSIFAGLEGHERGLMALQDYRRSNADPAGWWATEPDVGRVADGVPHRVDRLRALGNAVVPQVVEWIGRRIVAFDEEREVSVA